ncbi:hypothetical protein CYMTET_46825 [Cymbomonas tetramitiformis]|uniref:Serine aminopeptidase S33 domain-containing protein n=1 Tax=Cymbomonas tetramitiformis TaxID=36881 RepID=A0AAE0EX90_9CHLO|nr:hypothetical protein CYMTET_46825 [Cymbomonas tetramitiformis]|eukprot:gene19698-23563_t
MSLDHGPYSGDLRLTAQKVAGSIAVLFCFSVVALWVALSKLPTIPYYILLTLQLGAFRRFLRYTFPQRTRLFYDARSTLLSDLLPELHALTAGYAPALMLPSGVLQTAAAECYAPPPSTTPFDRETVALEALDFGGTASSRKTSCCPNFVPAGTISLDWLHLAQERGPEGVLDPRAPVCILVPGLTGSSQAAYIRRLALTLNKKEFRVACYNPRGRGGNPLETPFLYSIGYTEDLRRVVQRIRTRFPEATLTAAGFSLGSNYLAKYVGEESDKCMLAAAVSVAPPTDCIAMSNHLLHSSIGKLLDPYLVNSCKKMLRELRDGFPGVMEACSHVDLKAVTAARNMTEFDDAAIAPMFGCSCASDYYREGGAGSYLNRIRIPHLFLAAANDPIVPAHLIRTDNFKTGRGLSQEVPNPVLLAVTEEGGHSMVWPEGMFGDRSWACEAIAEFLEVASSKTVE